MKEQSQATSRTILFPKYATIPAKQTQEAYSPRKSTNRPQKDKQMGPFKQFQQCFGNVYPSFFKELQHIFADSMLEDKSASVSPRPSYNVQGSNLNSRINSIRRKRQLSKTPNNFTTEAFRVKQIYRKAKLNIYVPLHSKFEHYSQQDEETATILGKSGDIAKETKLFNRIKRLSWAPVSKTARSSTLEKTTIISQLNPQRRQIFTASDLIRAVAFVHQIKVKTSASISYFNVYVEEGNNSQLLKMLIRRRSGWRVVEIPSIANFIWTKFYKKGILRKRLNRRQKTQIEQEKSSSKQNSFRTGKSPPKNNTIQYNSPMRQVESIYSLQLRKLIPNSKEEDIISASGPRTTLKQLAISPNVLVHNHFPMNKCISDKNNLLINLTRYLSGKGESAFQFLPQSYELTDLNHQIIQKIKHSEQEKVHWIIKPGQNSNRGRGIIVTHTKEDTLFQLEKRLTVEEGGKKKKNSRNSLILQKYLTPLLYNRRKFDIRSFMLVTFLNNKLRIYSYEQCYIRTSCKLFEVESSNKLVHLTNDAIQCQSPQYGKFEEGNKVSQYTFSQYIDGEYKKKTGEDSIWKELKRQMELRCIDIIESSYGTLLSGLEHKNSIQQGLEQKSFYFQLFGMDFMIDDNFKLWLIEVNTNPAITHECSKVLNLLIPRMLDNMLALAVEPIMKPLRIPETPFNNRFTAIYERQIE